MGAATYNKGETMPQSIDVLASAIHDAKNQIFFADNLAASLAARHGIDLLPLREAIERASSRLTRALMAYRIESGVLTLSISPVSVSALIEDAAAIARGQYEHLGLQLEVQCEAAGLWPLDRDLVLDALSNALENAARFARSRVTIDTRLDDGMLAIRVRDDGARSPDEAPSHADHMASPARGLGLHIGRKVAQLHQRRGRHGELRFDLQPGGGVFEITLP